MVNQNKRVKVFYMGQRLKDMYPHATAWQVFKYRLYRLWIKTLWILALTVVVIAIFEAGNLFGPKTVITLPPTQVIKEVPIQAIVLERIAKCESPTGHYDKNGQISMGANTNHSVDIGKFQINNYAWGKKATELGYNLTVEKDNEAMANWIYTNRGTEDWYSSKSCWMK